MSKEIGEKWWHTKLYGLRFYGGKAGFGKAEWIVGLLPWDRDQTFCVPFGGQAGVLSRRAPVRNEIYNDLDGNLANWWRMVQRHPEELGWAVECVPHSEEFFWNAVEKLSSPHTNPMQRAISFYTVANQTVAKNMANPQWRSAFQAGPGSLGRWRSQRVLDLSERFRNVQIFCRPAERLLERMAEESTALIYADPPYHSGNTEGYAVCELDVPRLTELFDAQKGMVAISGYGDEWSQLGWRCHERDFKMPSKAWMRHKKTGVRTEKLWVNYDINDYIGGLFREGGRADSDG